MFLQCVSLGIQADSHINLLSHCLFSAVLMLASQMFF